MGTPLKSMSLLLTPKALSPLSPFANLSPKLLSVTRSGNVNINKKVVKGIPRVNEIKESLVWHGCNYNRTRYGKLARKNHVSKKLEFSKKPLLEPVHIKISDVNEVENEITRRDVVINTPNKLEIVKNGLEEMKFLNILGKGSFGQVIRGIHQGKFVAVKVVKNISILKEKNALNLNHNNIVKTIDIIEREKENFSLVIMEYLPNSKQLQTILEYLDIVLEKKLKKFATDICKGLDYCHKNGVLHLDIKPQNVLVYGDTCKICDFGNSVKISEVHNFNHQGTVLYTAPELLHGKEPTEKCDIYSLGILFWQLRSRSPPYGDIDNIETVIYQVVKCNWRPENNAPIDEYSKLYQTCWSSDPQERPCVSNILETLVKMEL